MTDIGDRAEQVGRQAQHSSLLDAGVRFGMLVYGIVHLIVAWLAVQLALGEQGQNASQKGAMRTLAKQPFGTLLLWLVAIGMFLLVLWRGVGGGGGGPQDEGGERRGRRGGPG